jgi:hypothetical protein
MRHLKLVESHASSIQQDLTFEQWLADLGKKIKAFGGFLTILSAGVPLLYPILSKHVPYNPQWTLPAACSIQFVLIFVLILWLSFVRVRNFSRLDESSAEAKARDSKVRDECGYENTDEWAKGKNDAQTALSHYRTCWMTLLVCLLMQYALLTLSYLPFWTNYKHVLVIFVTFSNNCVALAFLFCYFTLDQPDVSSGQGKQNGKEKYWALWVATLIVLTVVEAVCMALAWRNNQPNSFTPEDVSKVFMYISGVGTSVAMGFFIIRLARKELACPIWVLALLIIYMAIQPLFPVFSTGNPWGTIIIANIALLLKVLLCLYMMFLFEHGRLLFYFVRIRRLSDRLNAQMKHFTTILEI